MSGTIDAKAAFSAGDADWIYAAEAARILGVRPVAIRKMVLGGLLTTKKLPFTRVMVSKTEIQKIAEDSVQLPKS